MNLSFQEEPLGFIPVALGVYSLILGTCGASVQGRLVEPASAPLCPWVICFCHWLDHGRVITWATSGPGAISPHRESVAGSSEL